MVLGKVHLVKSLVVPYIRRASLHLVFFFKSNSLKAKPLAVRGPKLCHPYTPVNYPYGKGTIMKTDGIHVSPNGLGGFTFLARTCARFLLPSGFK